jgi:glycosyltransferase involved in cell wall biosynthesis
MLKEPTVVVVKSSSWKTAYQSGNHPEYKAIFDLLHRYNSRIHFVLVGTSSTTTREILSGKGITAWDIQAPGKLWDLGYYLDLMKLLFKYRPNFIIVLGLLNILPVAFYSLLSRKSKYVPVFIGEFGYYGSKRAGRLLTILAFKGLKLSLRLLQGKIFNMYTLSNSTKEQIEQLAPNLKGRVQLISYPISSVFCSSQNHTGSKHDEIPILLTIAGIEPRKGLDTLVKAVSLLQKETKVIIKGAVRSSAYLLNLKRMAKNLKVEDKLTFITDTVDYDDLASYYRSASVFVFPSREDCLGVVILEALHCGVPVIATSVGGIPDMVENGSNGILIQSDSPKELADAISLLLDNDDLRQKLSQNAKLVLDRRYYKARITLNEALVQSIEGGLFASEKGARE